MASEFRLLVKAGRHERRGCPVCVSLPAGVGEVAGGVLTDSQGNRIPAQAVINRCGCGHAPAQGAEGPCLTWVIDKLAAGEEREYTLELAPPAPSKGVKVEDNKRGQVKITVGGKHLTTYRYEGNPARPCFFPVLGPGGARVTRSWPIAEDVPGEATDHPHHRSLWVAHGDVNGVNNWHEGAECGKQIHRGFSQLLSGSVFGVLEAKNDWTDKEGNKTCEEVRKVTVYTQPDDSRLFDFEVTFFATNGDVTFGDTKEGGILAMRVATSMDASGAGFITNAYGGAAEGECWGKRASWCDYTGPVKDKTFGIAIMEHTGSFRYPTWWHVRNYGMYCANPFGLRDYARGDKSVDGSHTLPAGQCLQFRYRVYLHRGNAAKAKVAERYHDFINPPKVEVIV